MRPEEFQNRVLPLHAGLYRFARSLLNHREEAEDCVQEVMTKLWSKKNTLSHVRDLKAYCFQIMRNHCLDILRKNKMDLKDIDTGIPSDSDVHTEAEMTDKLAIVQRLISRLPEPQRTVIHLRSIEAWEMNEIAEVTGTTVEHARVILSRARLALRQAYQTIYAND